MEILGLKIYLIKYLQLQDHFSTINCVILFFQPNMYRLLQRANIPISQIAGSRYFKTKRNRVELITDFAPGVDAEVISSLQIHPQGWVCLSRYTSADEATEVIFVIYMSFFPLCINLC